jgi:RNA polymerase sigma-70 factor (ECF subfamily)
VDRDGSFTTTKWSVVLHARERGDPGAREALASLCEAYWYPLYVFVRRQGIDASEALDLTQGFFTDLLERDLLDSVRPERGKFRSFLIASLKHHIAHEKRKERALKRGGGRAAIPLDSGEAERRYLIEAADEMTPERAYERQWALAVIGRAQGRLRGALEADGQGEQYRLLMPFLTDVGPARPYQEVAGRLGTTEASVKMAVLRLRRRLGQLLREEIAHTVDEPSEVDAELRHLLAVLGEG